MAKEQVAEAAPKKRSRLGAIVALGLGLGVLVAGGAGAVAYFVTESPLATQRSESAGGAKPRSSASAVADGSYEPPVRTVQVPWGPIQSLAFDDTGKTIVACSRDGAVKSFNLEDRNSDRSFAGLRGQAFAVALHPGTNTLAAVGGQQVGLWSFETGDLSKTLSGHGGLVSKVAFNRDGSRVVTSSLDGTVRMWDAASGKTIHTLKHDGTPVGAATYGPQGKLVASGGHDGAVRVWDAETGERTALYRPHAKAVNDLVFTPDGRAVISASDDRTVVIWLLTNQKKIHTLRGFADEVWALALSPSGNTLLVGTKADAIHAWDMRGARLVKRMSARLNSVTALAFSPDGSRFAAAGEEAAIKIWRTPGWLWRPPMPPEDYQPPADPPAKSKEEELVRQAERLLNRMGEGVGAVARARPLLEQAIAINAG